MKKTGFDIQELKARFYIPILFLSFFVLLASRRWQQLVVPQVWSEDGVKVVADFIRFGWKGFFLPVNGYLITVPKVLSAISLSISFSQYPAISTYLAWFFIVFVGLAIVQAPTHLNGRFLCAIAVFTIPTDPEVFGLPLYTFWWASLLLFLCAFWDEKRPLLGWRLLFLLLGGLSSPVIALVLPVLYWRAYFFRSFKVERIMALVATPIAVVQLFFIAQDAIGQKAQTLGITGSHLGLVKVFCAKFLNWHFLPVFFGNFVIGNILQGHRPYFMGVVVFSFVLIWLIQKRKSLQTWTLFYLLVGSILLTDARVDLGIISPHGDGPRYFFFIFILIAWVLIDFFYNVRQVWFRVLIGMTLAVSVVNAVPVWSRTHDDLHWTDHVLSAQFFDNYDIPIMLNGSRDWLWKLNLSGEVNRRLLSHDLLASSKDLGQRSTYPYKTLAMDARNKELDLNTASLIKTTMASTEARSDLKGYRIISSSRTSNRGTVEVLLRVRRGDHLLFRSGLGGGQGVMTIEDYGKEFIQTLPFAKEWTVLEFSNQKLPDRFILKISELNRGPEQWCEVALRK